VTQKVDLESDILGFFHEWLIAFSRQFSSVVTIALSRGVTLLPDNVRVETLGKEKGCSRYRSVLLFFKNIWHERNACDVVLVHMTPIFVLLGWPLWRLWRKRIVLWYNHRQGGPLARIAIGGADLVLCTSEHSYSARFSKTKLMPAGVPTEMFRANEALERTPSSVLFLGRVSPVKKIETLIQAARRLSEEGCTLRLRVVGSPAVRSDEGYEKSLQASARTLVDAGVVSFSPAVTYRETPRLYNQHEVFVNSTPSGSFDKTVLEAMACECLVLVSNRSFEGILPMEFLFREGDSEDLARKLKAILGMGDEEKRAYRRRFRGFVVEHHGLDALAEQMRRTLT
jgi:glycosyltransferase involved in cell wall biosynthesis